MDPKTVARTWFDNIDQKNFEGVRRLMHAEHVFDNPMTPAPVGADAHVGMMERMTGAFTGEHVLDLVLAEGDHVVVRGRWQGTHTGEFNGLAASGKPVKFTFTDIFEVIDGRVRREAFEMNVAAMMAQVAG